MLINQVKGRWDEECYRQSGLCDKDPEPQKARLVKGNKCKTGATRAQDKVYNAL